MTLGFRRDLLRGSLDLMVLSVLMDGAKYGYMIQKHLKQASQGRVELMAGTLYPILHRLESEQLIRSRWEESSAQSQVVRDHRSRNSLSAPAGGRVDGVCGLHGAFVERNSTGNADGLLIALFFPISFETRGTQRCRTRSLKDI